MHITQIQEVLYVMILNLPTIERLLYRQDIREMTTNWEKKQAAFQMKKESICAQVKKKEDKCENCHTDHTVNSQYSKTPKRFAFL